LVGGSSVADPDIATEAYVLIFMAGTMDLVFITLADLLKVDLA
jgi:hypothetical protein